MSRHSDYIIRERTQILYRAVGFAGSVEQFINKASKKQEKGQGIYSYDSKKDSDGQDHWLTYLVPLPIVILLAFGFNPLLGFVLTFVGLVAAGICIFKLRTK